MGETCRQFGVRRTENQNEADELGNQHFTRKQCKTSQSILHKSAISDHISQNNHNRDEGQHFLPIVYNPIIRDRFPSSDENKKNKKKSI